MPACVVCFVRNRSKRINSRQGSIFPSDLEAELEDSRKFSLISLTTFLAMLAISKSRALQPVVSTLLMYTITLRLALNTCFLQDHPTMSRLLHAVPLLSISCMVGVELVSCMQSPALGTICILLGVLPLVTMVVHHGRHYAETSAAESPMGMDSVPAPAMSGSTADITPALNQAGRSLEVLNSNTC